MITCQLTKLEAAFDQVRKTYPKMKPADAALLSSALVVTGRHAIALYEGEQYRWPADFEKLTQAMAPEVEIAKDSVEGAKRTKSSPEEEPLLVGVGLMPNFSAGERILEGRDDLKKTLSEALQEGVEYVYSATDLGWQWALDHVNWTTVTGLELVRKVKVKASFTEGAVGVEMGTAGAKKRPSRAKAAKDEAAPKTEEPAKAEEAPAAKADEKPAEAKEEPAKAKAKGKTADAKEAEAKPNAAEKPKAEKPKAEKPKAEKPKAKAKAK